VAPVKRLLDWLAYRLVPRDFVVVTIDGVGCTCDPVMACEMAAEPREDVVSTYEFRPARMTARAFDRLGEFEGW